MNIIKNIVMILIAIFIITAVFSPRIFGFSTGIIVLGLGWVLFMLGRGLHVKADVINRAELYVLSAFLMGSILVLNASIERITLTSAIKVIKGCRFGSQCLLQG